MVIAEKLIFSALVLLIFFLFFLFIALATKFAVDACSGRLKKLWDAAEKTSIAKYLIPLFIFMTAFYVSLTVIPAFLPSKAGAAMNGLLAYTLLYIFVQLLFWIALFGAKQGKHAVLYWILLLSLLFFLFVIFHISLLVMICL